MIEDNNHIVTDNNCYEEERADEALILEQAGRRFRYLEEKFFKVVGVKDGGKRLEFKCNLCTPCKKPLSIGPVSMSMSVPMSNLDRHIQKIHPSFLKEFKSLRGAKTDEVGESDEKEDKFLLEQAQNRFCYMEKKFFQVVKLKDGGSTLEFKCILCKSLRKTLSIGSHSMANLNRHIQNTHPSLLDEFTKLREANAPAKTRLKQKSSLALNSQENKRLRIDKDWQSSEDNGIQKYLRDELLQPQCGTPCQKNRSVPKEELLQLRYYQEKYRYMEHEYFKVLDLKKGNNKPSLVFQCKMCPDQKGSISQYSSHISNLYRHITKAHPDSLDDFKRLNAENSSKRQHSAEEKSQLGQWYQRNVQSLEELVDGNREFLLEQARSRFHYYEETFFEVLGLKDGNSVIEFKCKLCHSGMKPLSIGRHSTSNLSRHVLNLHPSFYDEFITLRDANNPRKKIDKGNDSHDLKRKQVSEGTDVHKNIQNEVKQFICFECDMTFVDELELEEHESAHGEEGLAQHRHYQEKYHYMEEDFFSYVGLRDESGDNLDFQCKMCPPEKKPISSKPHISNLYRHIKTVHPFAFDDFKSLNAAQQAANLERRKSQALGKRWWQTRESKGADLSQEKSNDISDENEIIFSDEDDDVSTDHYYIS